MLTWMPTRKPKPAKAKADATRLKPRRKPRPPMVEEASRQTGRALRTEILFVDDVQYREMLRRALRDVRLSGGCRARRRRCSNEVMRKIWTRHRGAGSQAKAELGST